VAHRIAGIYNNNNNNNNNNNQWLAVPQKMGLLTTILCLPIAVAWAISYM